MTPAKTRAMREGPDSVGSWWAPATPDDVRAEQKRVDTARANLVAALLVTPPTGNPGAIDRAVRGWNDVEQRAASYVADQPSVLWWTRDSQVKTGQSLETEIESYRQTFATLAVSVPQAPPPSVVPADPLSSLASIGDTAKLLLVGAAVFLLLRKN